LLEQAAATTAQRCVLLVVVVVVAAETAAPPARLAAAAAVVVERTRRRRICAVVDVDAVVAIIATSRTGPVPMILSNGSRRGTIPYQRLMLQLLFVPPE